MVALAECRMRTAGEDRGDVVTDDFAMFLIVLLIRASEGLTDRCCYRFERHLRSSMGRSRGMTTTSHLHRLEH